jgi:hypothetical protein
LVAVRHIKSHPPSGKGIDMGRFRMRIAIASDRWFQVIDQD